MIAGAAASRAAVRTARSRSARQAPIRVAVLACAALATWGCRRPEWIDPVVTWERIQVHVDSLGARGQIAEAGSFVRSARAVAGTPAWLARDLDATAATLGWRASAPPPLRAALQDADAGAIQLAELNAGGFLAEAHALAWRIAHARASTLGLSDLSAARARLALAEVAFTMGRPTEADSLARDVLAHLPDGPTMTHPLAALAEQRIGRVIKNYVGPSLHDSSIAHYSRALAVLAHCDASNSVLAADVHREIANAERPVDNIPGALAQLQQAIAILSAHPLEAGDRLASTWTDTAYLWATEGDWPQVGQCMRAAFAATPRLDRVTPSDRAFRFGLLGQALRRTGHVDESIDVLRESAAAAETAWARTSHDAASSIQSGLNIHRELAFALAMHGESVEAFEELERGQSRLWSPRATGDPPAPVFARVQHALPGDAALVAWPFTTPFSSGGDFPRWACVVRSTGAPAWVRIDRVGPWSTRSPRDVLRGQLVQSSEWPLRVMDTRSVDSLASLVGRLVFKPIESHLNGVHRLIVSGPDLMYLTPLGMLRDARGVRLDERFVITYVPSARAFADLSERSSHAPPTDPGSALLVGAPDAGRAEADSWPPLSGAAEELQGLARLLPGARVLAGAEASASRLEQMAHDGTLARMEVVHLATHVEMRRGRVVQPVLVLAPDRAADSLGSRLTYAQIADTWHVNARLVDLAGCSSGLGFFTHSEGWLGLHNAFLAAGAHNVLVSLWPVDDEATRRLMLEFHGRLRADAGRYDPALALQQAQRAVREYRAPDGSTPFRHPVYWAGFALVGPGTTGRELPLANAVPVRNGQ